MKHRSAKLLGTGILIAGLTTPFVANAHHNDGDWIFAVGTALTLAHYYDHDNYYPRHRYHNGYHARHYRSHKHWRKHQRRAHRNAHKRWHKRARIDNRYSYSGRHDRRHDWHDGRRRQGRRHH